MLIFQCVADRIGQTVAQQCRGGQIVLQAFESKREVAWLEDHDRSDPLHLSRKARVIWQVLSRRWSAG
jgi:hypothetical protein